MARERLLMENALYVNQERAVQWELSMGEALLFSYLVLPSGWMKAHPVDGSFRWLSSAKLAMELPMVCSHVASVRRHMKALEDKGLIDRTVHDSMSYYRVTQKGWLWRSPTSSMPAPDLPPESADTPRADRRDPPSESAHPPRANPLTPPSESAHQSVPPDPIHQRSSCAEPREPSSLVGWAQWFVTEHGYDFPAVKTAKTMAMYRAWIAAGVTAATVAEAMEIATAKLGEPPGSPTFLRGIVADVIAEADRPAPESRARSAPRGRPAAPAAQTSEEYGRQFAEYRRQKAEAAAGRNRPDDPNVVAEQPRAALGSAS